MFAYCANTPVNCIDESGRIPIWGHLKQLVLWGFIHYCVQEQICNNENDIDKELWLTKNGKLCGRADLMNKDGEVWEVKHSGTNPALRTLHASLQAISYKDCKAIRTNTYVTGLGRPHAFSGSFVINTATESYLVNYKTPTWGVVLYSVEQIKYQDAYDYYLGKKQKEAVTPASGMTMFPIIIVPDFAGCFPLIKNEYGVT